MKLEKRSSRTKKGERERLFSNCFVQSVRSFEREFDVSYGKLVFAVWWMVFVCFSFVICEFQRGPKKKKIVQPTKDVFVFAFSIIVKWRVFGNVVIENYCFSFFF